MYSQINIFIEFSCNLQNNNTTMTMPTPTTWKRQLEQMVSQFAVRVTLSLVFYDLESFFSLVLLLLWHTTCRWRCPITSNGNSKR